MVAAAVSFTLNPPPGRAGGREKFRCAAAKDAARGLEINAILANGQQQMPYLLAVGACTCIRMGGEPREVVEALRALLPISTLTLKT